MRVIAGVARSCPLVAPVGNETRPTTDKTKETLFNVLMPYLYSDGRFLDLFSGSGAIGIEALSRGMEFSCFVEKSRSALKCIEANLLKTHFSDDAHSRVMAMDVFSALHQLEGDKAFDIVFMDPPYDTGIEKCILEYLSASRLISKDSIIVVEASNMTDFDYLSDLGLYIWKRKEYKNSCHVFIKIDEKDIEG